MRDMYANGKVKKLIETSCSLFTEYGFYNVGVDTIIRESKIAKMTLYRYFESKEKMIEACVKQHTEILTEQVESIIQQTKYPRISDKLRQIFYLHADLNGPYYLIFRAILEIRVSCPVAFSIVTKYKLWLLNSVHHLIKLDKFSADFKDAHLFLFVMDGAFTRLLSNGEVDERAILLDHFLAKFYYFN